MAAHWNTLIAQIIMLAGGVALVQMIDGRPLARQHRIRRSNWSEDVTVRLPSAVLTLFQSMSLFPLKPAHKPVK